MSSEMLSHILVSLLLFAPLLGFLVNGCRYKSQNGLLAGVIASGAVVISLLASLGLWFQLLGMPEGRGRRIAVHFFDWISVGDFQAKASFLVDPLSLVMLLVITGVGLLIHIFSIGYMSEDDRPAKYFAYLNLFLFNMLVLVLGDNLLVMFVGWEGVGLCSYLLIGFWFTDSQKANAGMKAFITNRIGDAGFLLGIFTLFMALGTIEFTELLSSASSGVPENGWGGPLTWACLFLFIGATGKSAQIPLYVWLPDAMAGPTPVSALIHAATMVTAGVYMIVRLDAVFLMAPQLMAVIAVIGGLTALMAASIGMTQWDIKKVLAYSTVSQLGYMFLAVGVGAFMPALFHLMTHAFFKALMFLGSGSVIHAMNGEQDIRKMGGLKKIMPITHITFLIGWLAIIGIPPLAGFFSKDEILWYSFVSPLGSPFLWLIGVVGAGMTAFYMTRLMALTFWGESRVPKEIHPHESPRVMTVPLIFLAFLSIVGGWLGIPHVISAVLPGHPSHILEHWLAPLVSTVDLGTPSVTLEWILIGFSVLLAIACGAFAYHLYIDNPDQPKRLVQKIHPLYRLVHNKYFVDEIYMGKIVSPLVDISKGLWFYIDVNLIDRVTYVLTDFMKNCGGGLRLLQNGNMQQYAFYIVLGLIGMMTIIFVG